MLPRKQLRRRFLAQLLVLASLAAGTQKGVFAADTVAPHRPGVVLVKFRQRLTKAAVASPGLQKLVGPHLGEAHALITRDTPLAGGVDRLYALRVDADTDVVLLAQRLSRLPEVEYAEPALEYELVDAGPVSVQLAPNDPFYATNQTYLDNLDLEAAWDIARGETTSPVVCVVDGGTNWQHEDLNANMWVNAGEIADNLMDDDGNGYVDDIHGWNFQSDNGNPRGDFATTPGAANHGTHTAGLLGAVTNNGTGIASASWNPRLMAVNAAGQQDNIIAFGYEGVLYAAENGADIVSLSWGGTSSSQALQDIIDFAVSQGVLVVAAAGNNNNNVPFYPAAYRGVYAVANVWGQTDVRYSGPSGSCYGSWLDVAAPGVSIYSTFDFGVNNQYGNATGTSMAAPIAAAVAALIVSQHPDWHPFKVGEQLRATCDDINAANPDFADLLGRGRVNAFRAVSVSTPGVRVTGQTLADADGNGDLNQGESVVLSVDLHNYLAPATGLSLTLSTTSPWITVVDDVEASSDLAEDADVSLPNAFSFIVDADTPPGTAADLRIGMNAAGYSDFQLIPIALEPVFKTHDINNLEISLTGTGNLGWVGFAGGAGENGDGFRFQGGPNLLFEGAFLVGTSPTSLSDAARSGAAHTDFAPLGNQAPSKSTPGTRADQEILGGFQDSGNTSTPLGVEVSFQSYAYAAAPLADFVLVEYRITNTSGSTFTNLHAGLWCDWDIDEEHYDTNVASWDPSRQLGYAFDTVGSLPYVGILGLSGNSAYSAIQNDGTGQPITIYGGFSKTEKWLLLDGGTGITTAGPSDISTAISSGPYLVQPGETVSACFALLAGNDLASLQASADLARMILADSIRTSTGDGIPLPPSVPGPSPLRLGAPFPNPFNPGTQLALTVDRERWIRVAVYDVRGRLVRTLVDGRRAAGTHLLHWDGRRDDHTTVPSGVYFAQLTARGQRDVHRLVLLQ